MKSSFSSGRKLTPAELEFHVGELTEQGYTIIPDAVDAEYLAPAIEAVEDIYQRESEIALRLGTSSVHCWSAHCIVGKHPFFETFYLNPPVLSVCREYLGEDMVLYDTTARSIRPSEGREPGRGFQIHADRSPFSIVPFEGGKHYPMAVQSAWCISEFTRENGATLIWPGSHLSLEVPPEQPETLPPGYLYTEAPAGSVILWDSALWHTSGTNCGSGPRYSLVFYFHRWWLKGFNDSYRLVPEQARAAMTPEERRLWGLEAAVPPNTHFRGMSAQQIAALTPEEKAVLNIAAF
jgi:ectoine hydroxylase-related dioxygenase (phytanoyl-CoA dioxygenase family)